MDMTIPSIVLFGAMLIGLSFIPMTIRDIKREIKDAFGKEERTDEDDYLCRD
jgi:hypothetical protein